MEEEYVRVRMSGLTVEYLRKDLVLAYMGFSDTKPAVSKRITAQVFGKDNIVTYIDFPNTPDALTADQMDVLDGYLASKEEIDLYHFSLISVSATLLPKLQSVQKIRFSEGNWFPSDLSSLFAGLRLLRQVKEIRLPTCSDGFLLREGLAHLQAIPSLQVLDMRNCWIELDACIAVFEGLRAMKLKSLDVRYISDDMATEKVLLEGLSILQEDGYLETLFLGSNNGNYEIEKLVEGFPIRGLSSLTLEGIPISSEPAAHQLKTIIEGNALSHLAVQFSYDFLPAHLSIVFPSIQPSLLTSLKVVLPAFEDKDKGVLRACFTQLTHLTHLVIRFPCHIEMEILDVLGRCVSRMHSLIYFEMNLPGLVSSPTLLHALRDIPTLRAIHIKEGVLCSATFAALVDLMEKAQLDEVTGRCHHIKLPVFHRFADVLAHNTKLSMVYGGISSDGNTWLRTLMDALYQNNHILEGSILLPHSHPLLPQVHYIRGIIPHNPLKGMVEETWIAMHEEGSRLHILPYELRTDILAMVYASIPTKKIYSFVSSFSVT